MKIGEGTKIKFNIIPIETDVLIIGGGLGGCLAAIRASECGASVTIVEKANTSHSGSAENGIDHSWAFCSPVHEKMGWTIEDMSEDHMQAYGLVDKDLFYLVASTMYDRISDLEKFGLNFRMGYEAVIYSDKQWRYYSNWQSEGKNICRITAHNLPIPLEKTEFVTYSLPLSASP